MSRLKPSANFIIVTELRQNSRSVRYLKCHVKNLHKRLYDLKKMGFAFDEFTENWLDCIDMIYIPDDLYIDFDKQTIKVGNYWNDYRNDLEKSRNEDEQLYDFYCNATLPQLLWFEFKESVKQFISKLFK